LAGATQKRGLRPSRWYAWTSASRGNIPVERGVYEANRREIEISNEKEIYLEKLRGYGNVGSRATYRYFSKSCNSSEAADRFTTDVVIPRKRAISAVE